MTKIAIVGYGFVGKAVEVGFKNPQNEILIVDPHKGFSNMDDLDKFSPDFTFVCVPTPMGEDGSIDATIINEVVDKLKDIPSGVVIIKSTVTPDLVHSLCCYKRFVYNPEFLTERNALNDFLTPQFHVIGGRPEFTKKVKNLYQYSSNCNPAPIYYMTAVEASLVKYGINTFLAMKVTWFNQWKELTDSVGARYNVVSNAIGSDPRIGHSHTKVPGFDGKKGFGGSCFPKDTNAMYNFYPDLSVLKAVIDANNVYRSQYDLDDREKEQKVFFKKKMNKGVYI
jgi:nucleotide sugar dehydrogenase